MRTEVYLLRQHVEGEVFLGEGGERPVRRRAHVPPPGEPPQPPKNVRRERLNVNKQNRAGCNYNGLMTKTYCRIRIRVRTRTRIPIRCSNRE